MDNKAIETMSVSAVKTSIDVCPLLSQYINENEKGPMLDGYITIYNKPGKKNIDCIGHVNVQVKGEENTDLSKAEITYPISTTDLQYYKKISGAVFFVVYVNYNGHKIYYIVLTPVKIKSIIESTKEGQKTVSLALKAFPENIDEKENILINCYQNGIKQTSFCDIDLKTIDEYNAEKALEKVVIPITTVKGISFEAALLNNELALYAKIKGTDLLHPIEDGVEIKSIHKEYNVEVSIGDELFYDKISIVNTREHSICWFGNSFSITISHDKTKDIKFNYKDSPMVRIYAKDLAFMNAFIKHKNINLNRAELLKKGSFDNSIFDDYDLEKRKNSLKYANSIVTLLDQLHCEKDLNIEALSEQHKRNLSILLTAIIDGKPVGNLKDDLDNLIVLPIGELRFLLYFKKIANETYEIYDLFNCDFKFAFQNSDGAFIPIPVFYILKANDFSNIDNIPYDKILPSIQSFEQNEYTIERANYFLLELLNAYDKNNNLKKALFLAKELSEWLLNMDDKYLSQEIKTINYYQVKKRLKTLDDNDLIVLNQIAIDTDKDIIKAAAYLLLDKQFLAMQHFCKLSQQEQDDFKEFPISFFLPDEIK